MIFREILYLWLMMKWIGAEIVLCLFCEQDECYLVCVILSRWHASECYYVNMNFRHFSLNDYNKKKT